MERMRRVRNGTLIFYYVFTLCAAVLCLPVSYTHLTLPTT